MKRISLPFPQRVYNVLRFCEEQCREDIISWENNGASFKVNNVQVFQRDMLPRCLKTNKYSSFTRALYAYGFNCVRTGRQPGIYSHPNFNRNDPASPSLMKRVSTKKIAKATALKNTTSNSSIEEVENRTFSGKSCTWSLQKCQFPSIVDETGWENDSDGAETTFGRSYHTIDPDDADLVTSLPVETPPASELASVFDEEGSMCFTGSHQSPFSVASNTNLSRSKTSLMDQQTGTKSIPLHGSLFMLENAPVAPMVVASSQILMTGSDEGAQANPISNQDASEEYTVGFFENQSECEATAV